MVEFQTDDSAAPSHRRPDHQARIPMIAIDIPHPGATDFGANNYGAGPLAGHLARRHLSPAEGSASHGQPGGHAFIALPFRLCLTLRRSFTSSPH